MRFPLRTTPWVLALALLNLFGCAEKPDLIPTAVGSYQHEGIAINCLVEAHHTTGSSNGLSCDFLQVSLTTTPQPTNGPEVLRLSFFKRTDEPTSAYAPNDSFDLLRGVSSLSYFTKESATITQASDGSFSGSFSGRVLVPGGGAPSSTLSEWRV